MTRCDGRVGRNWRGSTCALPSSQREWIVHCFCEERQSRNAVRPQNASSGPVLHSAPPWTWGWSCLSPPRSWLLGDTSSVLCPFSPAHPLLQLPCPSSLGCLFPRGHSPSCLSPLFLVAGCRWGPRLLLFVPFILTYALSNTVCFLVTHGKESAANAGDTDFLFFFFFFWVFFF